MKHRKLIVASPVACTALMVYADITFGVTLSATGPAASLGISERNTIALLPSNIDGQKVNSVVLDDASDTTTAVKKVRKLLAENRVDLIIGSTITANSLTIMDLVAEAKTPAISMATSARMVDPPNPKAQWMFKAPQTSIWRR